MTEKTSRNIALIGYTSTDFFPFADRLRQLGFRVFWVHSLHSFTRKLLRAGVSQDDILDLSNPDEIARMTVADIDGLVDYEQAEMPFIHDILLMDRLVRQKPTLFGRQYCAYIAKKLSNFLTCNHITLVSSGRDTVLQLMGLLICKRHNILWAGVTYTRLPNDRFFFADRHTSENPLTIKAVTDQDREDAQQLIDAFRAKGTQTLFRVSSTSFRHVLKRLPGHLRLGLSLLKDAMDDPRNTFARYSIWQLVKIYAAKKRNLAQLPRIRFHDPEQQTRPFFLHGLHRQPESSVDVMGAFFSDQLALVRNLARATPVTHDLYVKTHISDADGWPLGFYRELERIPGVKLINPQVQSRELLERCALVITNTGTMGLEAALLGKPAILLSKVHFMHLPNVHYCPALPEIPALVQSLLKTEANPPNDETLVAAMATILASSFKALPNRRVFDQGLTADDLDILGVAYEHLYRYACAQSSNH
jgi:Capsule polysaccharide biosynthesis protein